MGQLVVGKRKRKKRSKAEGSRGYEAAINTPSRRLPWSAGQSQDAAAQGAIPQLRNWGRYLDENHDIASAALDSLIQGFIGSGIVTIPKPMNSDGSINERLGVDIMKAWRKWIRNSDVTNELPWSEAQRLIGRGWMRDGEYFIHHVSGRTSRYPFSPEQVPYRVELLEGDMVPWDFSQDQWRQGIRFNAWRAPTDYKVYLRNPGDFGAGMSAPRQNEVKDVPARLITHIKAAKRWPAARGISPFSTVISRLYDVKDLEESERLKNRQLASWVAAVEKSPDMVGYEATDEAGRRFHEAFGGMVIDSLAPGEKITGVGPDYPVASMPDHIADQIRRVAGGVGVRYSSLSKHYEGSYSAMRQEMVESVGMYQIREDMFTQKVVREVYERWLISASLSGMLMIPANADMSLVANAEFRGPVVPWIDPLKEVQADALAIKEGLADIDQIRIKRGAPAEMIGQPAPQAEPTPAASPRQLQLIEDEEEEEAAA